MPKQRDLIARDLYTNPLYRPKQTPSKKGTLKKIQNKHKGRDFPALFHI